MEYYIASLTNKEKQLKKNQPWVTDSDIFIEEAMDFFENRKFNKDIVGIIVKGSIRCIRDHYIYIRSKLTRKQEETIFYTFEVCVAVGQKKFT